MDFTIKFKPQKKSIKVAKGTDLLAAAIRAGVMLHASCGGEGLCGKCKVLINKREVLACQTIVESDLEVSVPEQSLETHAKIKHDSEEFTKGIVLKREGAYRHSPLIRKIFLKISKTSRLLAQEKVFPSLMPHETAVFLIVFEKFPTPMK